MYGYNIGKFKSMKIIELCPNGDEGMEELTLQDIFLKAPKGISFTAIHRRSDGKRIYVECNCKEIVYKNQKIGLNTIRDISERKRVESELKRYQNHLEEMVKLRTDELEKANQKLKDEVRARIKNEEQLSRLAAIVESTEVAVIGLDLDGNISSWNKAAEKLYGYSREEILGNSVFLFIPKNLTHEVQKNLNRVVQGDNSDRFETLWMCKDGHSINVSLTISRIQEAGKTTGISIIARDITERRQMELEMSRIERVNLINVTALGIGHEVRNPLATVRGFLQKLGEKEDCSPYKEYFELMIEEMDRANQILSEFLVIGTNKIPTLQLQNLNSIIKKMFPLIEADAAGQNKWVKFDLQAVPDIYLDDQEMRQVILNLVRNSLEAMNPGSSLYLKTYTEKESVVFEVEDEGSGIPQELMDKVGTPFFTTKEQGTGLGIMICKKIINRHKGKIDIYSSPAGTQVILRFNKP